MLIYFLFFFFFPSIFSHVKLDVLEECNKSYGTHPRGYKLHGTDHLNLQIKSVCTKPKDVHFFFNPQVSLSLSCGPKSQHSASVAVICQQNHTQAMLVLCLCLLYEKSHMKKKNSILYARQCLSIQNKTF